MTAAEVPPRRDRFFHEPMGPDEVRLMYRDYRAWLTGLFKRHGVCQLYLITMWPHSMHGDLTSSWRVPEGYTHVALSDRLAMDAAAFDGVMEEVEQADLARKALVDAGLSAGPYAPSRVLSVAAETRMAAESCMPHAWVGDGDGVIVSIEGTVMDLSSLGTNPPRRLEVSVDGWVRLGSDTRPADESERSQYFTTRCWVRGDPFKTLEVTTVCPSWDGRYVEQTGTFSLGEWSESALMRIAARALGTNEHDAFRMLCLLYGGMPDLTSAEFPRARLADMLCRSRGRVVRYHDDLRSAEEMFWRSHPKAGVGVKGPRP